MAMDDALISMVKVGAEGEVAVGQWQGDDR